MICTSIPLRTSTGISPGLVLPARRSLSLGSTCPSSTLGHRCVRAVLPSCRTCRFHCAQDARDLVLAGADNSLVRVSRRALCRCSAPAHASPRATARPPPRWDPGQQAPGATAGASSRLGRRHRLPSSWFQALFDSLFKVLFTFPSQYLCCIGLGHVFSLGRGRPPLRAALPSNATPLR